MAGNAQALNRAVWIVSASSSDVNGPAGNAIDGNENTRWSTGVSQTPGQWFLVDMGSPQTFCELVLDEGVAPGDFPRGYEVNVSNDGTNWGNPVATGNGTSGTTTIIFPTQIARYFRITQTGSASGIWWSIYELNAYATSAPPAPTDLIYSNGTAQIVLTWNAAVSATSYDVLRSTNFGGPYELIASDITALTYTDTNIISGVNYYYTVTALNSYGESPESANAMQGLESVTPTLNTNELVVVVATPQEYGAKGDGITDDSGAFQAAMNAVYNSGGNGGGVVYVPSANYAFYTNLTIPTGVTLHGDWQDWTMGSNGLVGTTFKVYYGAGSTNGSPFITMDVNSSLKGVNIWYPNQNPNTITPYPFTINQNGNNNCVVQNVVLVNSYLGIETSSNAKWIMSTLIGSPLYLGLTCGSIADICQTEDIRFSPAIWAASGLTNAPSVGGAYATWMRTYGTGMLLYPVDGLINNNTEISGYHIGLDFEGAGSAFYNGHVTNCAMAMNAQAMETTEGLEFSYFTLDGDTAVSRTSTTNDATVHFSDCTIIGRNGTAVYSTAADWQSVMGFQNCTISNTMQLAGPGVFNLVNCNLSGSTQCVMSASATRAAFTGCTFSPTQNIVNNGNAGNLIIDSRPSSQTAMPIVNWTNVINDYLSRQPAKSTLFVATSYGATGNGTTDDTAAINAALTAAASNGGGVVYLPAGNYHTTNTLSVPSGVELRGSYELRHGPEGGGDGIEKGSIIHVYGGQGTTNGPSAVALAANAGLVGMTFDYPNQNTNNIAFPPTVQGQGGNVYVIGVQCPGPWIFMDLDTYTCTNHFLYMLDGWALSTWIHAGNGSSGTIADTHGNPTFWLVDPSGMNQINWNAETTFASTNSQVYVLGNCTELFMKVFFDSEREFMHCTSENNQGPNVTAISAMCDGSYQSFIFSGSGSCTFTNVNAEWWVAYEPTPAGSYNNSCALVSTTNFTGTVRFLNVPFWGEQVPLYQVSGGDIGLELVQLPVGLPGNTINGGVFHLVNASDINGNTPISLTYGANTGIAGKTNEFIGCYAYVGCSAIIENLTNNYSIWNDYTLDAYNVLDVGPVLVGNFYPNGAYQFQSSSALTFQAASPNGINTSGITVQLTGTNLLGQDYAINYTSANGLIINGNSTARTVSVPLITNATYNAVVTVTDASGNETTNILSFDTINPAYTFEAEDFDYNGGHYYNNPQTNAYASLSGIAGIDFTNSEIGTGNASYRPQGLETEGASDTPRLAYSGGLQDYDVGFATTGNWGNYTRSFPAGTYNIYMRSASPNGPTTDSDSMYQVTVGHGTSNQTTSLMGTFSIPNTGNWQKYAWVPLFNNSGGMGTFTGGSVETLRVTTDNGNNNINCFMLVATNAVSYLSYISGSILEAENAILTGGAVVANDYTGYSGTGFVDGYYESTTADTKFDVNISSAGQYALAVRYSAGNGASTNTALYVNGVFITNLICNATADWNTWAFKNQRVALNDGTNTIEFKSTASVTTCINLDYITLTALTMPTLSIQSVSPTQGITLQWPDNGNADISIQPNLYYTSSLLPPIVWTMMTNTPVDSNGQWMVSLPIGTNNTGFYELQ